MCEFAAHVGDEVGRQIETQRGAGKKCQRGGPAGRRLIEMLIEVGRSQLSRDEVSLFVYRENTAAYNCYRALGFAISDYPADMPHADVCDFLTRRAHIEET